MDLPFYDSDGPDRYSETILKMMREDSEDDREHWGLDPEPQTDVAGQWNEVAYRWRVARLDEESIQLSRKLDELAGQLIEWVMELHADEDDLDRLRDELGALQHEQLTWHWGNGVSLPYIPFEPPSEDGQLFAGYRDRALDVLRYFLDRRLCDVQVAGFANMVDRLMELHPLVLSQRPRRSAVRRFLQRVSRCYVFGFFPECLIVCRAVLENAVKETLDGKRSPHSETPEGVWPMRTKLDWARTRKWLSNEGHARASTVWMRGNRAVHDDPLATKDVFGTIEMTMDVLEELYSVIDEHEVRIGVAFERSGG